MHLCVFPASAVELIFEGNLMFLAVGGAFFPPVRCLYMTPEEIGAGSIVALVAVSHLILLFMFVSCSNTRNIVGVTFKLRVIIYWLYLVPLLSVPLLHIYYLLTR